MLALVTMKGKQLNSFNISSKYNVSALIIYVIYNQLTVTINYTISYDFLKLVLKLVLKPTWKKNLIILKNQYLRIILHWKTNHIFRIENASTFTQILFEQHEVKQMTVL